MDLLGKLMGGLDIDALQGMIPQPKVIESYKILSCETSTELEKEANELIQQGYEPIGFLIKYQSSNYIREFVKYKKTTQPTDAKE